MRRVTDRLGRRELLVAFGTVGLGGAFTYLWTGFDPGQGRVTARKVTAEERTLLYQDDEDEYVTGLLADRGFEDPADVLISEHLDDLHAEYGPLDYQLRIVDLDSEDEEWFSTPDMSVFDTVSVGDYLTYQVSLTDADAVQSLTCVASEREALETRCEYDGIDILE